MDRDRVEVKSVRITFYWQTKNGLFSFTYNASFSLSHTHTHAGNLSLSHTHTHTHKTSISLSLPLSFSQFYLFQTFSYFVKYELEEVKVDTKIKNQEKSEWNLKKVPSVVLKQKYLNLNSWFSLMKLNCFFILSKVHFPSI